jgi:hypothetical protein
MCQDCLALLQERLVGAQHTDTISQGMQLGLVQSGAQAVGVVTDECICAQAVGVVTDECICAQAVGVVTDECTARASVHDLMRDARMLVYHMRDQARMSIADFRCSEKYTILDS